MMKKKNEIKSVLYFKMSHARHLKQNKHYRAHPFSISVWRPPDLFSQHSLTDPSAQTTPLAFLDLVRMSGLFLGRVPFPVFKWHPPTPQGRFPTPTHSAQPKSRRPNRDQRRWESTSPCEHSLPPSLSEKSFPNLTQISIYPSNWGTIHPSLDQCLSYY